MKFENKDILDKLGIEAGKTVFHVRDYETWEFTTDGRVVNGTPRGSCGTTMNCPVPWLIDKEITFAPRYDLTKDDRVVVIHLFQGWNNWDMIERQKSGLLYIIRFPGMKDDEETIFFPMANILMCIKEGERVRISELAKLL